MTRTEHLRNYCQCVMTRMPISSISVIRVGNEIIEIEPNLDRVPCWWLETCAAQHSNCLERLARAICIRRPGSWCPDNQPHLEPLEAQPSATPPSIDSSRKS